MPAWLFITMLLPLNILAQSGSNSYTVTEGSTLTVYASKLGNAQYDVGTKSWSYSNSYKDGTDNIIVLSESTWSANILAIKPGSASMTHNEQYFNGGEKWAHYSIYITVKASNNPKLQLTPSVERTRVLKGTSLKLTSSESGSTIYYVTSGNVLPGKSSTFPSSGLTINSQTTIKAQAVKSSYPLSDVFERTYEIVDADFQATVAGGTVIYFKIISEEDKTCQVVYVPEESTGTLRIPTLINGYSVTGIGEQAIMGCKNITSVVVPASIISIGKNAFEGCTGLNTLTLPEGLTQLGEGAFKGCTGLTSINVPASVTSFGKSTFADCTTLSEVDLAAGLTLIGEQAFEGCTAITSISLPNSLTQLGSNAFYNCTGLTSVTLPSSIANFGTATFKGCSGLQTVNVSNGLQDIGIQTFADCTNLTSVNLPTTLQKIGNSMFSGCTGLTSIVIPAGVTEISSSAFNGCSGLTSIIIPASVTAIGSKAFSGCPAMKTITSYIADPYIISDNVFTCYDETVTLFVPYGTSDMYWSVSGWIQFMNIEEMPLVVTDITLPSNQVVYNGRNIILEPTIIPVDAQTTLTWTSDDANIATVDSNGQVTGVAEGTTTIRVTTDNGLTASCQIKVIGIIDFADAAVKALCIANWDTDGDGELNKEEAAAVTSLKSVFKGNKEIKSFDEFQYFTRVTSFLSWEFGNCSALTSLIIPRGITSIPSYTFSGCTSLRSVSIPNSVTTISAFAFYGCI